MRPPRLHPSTKIKTLTWIGAALAMLAIAVPVRADFAMPDVPGFSNSYPWFNTVSQYPENQSFQYFLAYHPNIAQALARNPSLLYNASWRYQFPALEQYLANHPYEWQALNQQDWAEGLPETPWGGYDQEHQWRDAYWWHANDPNWFYDNHQAWASLDSRWLTQDGAYDAHHQWHYGEWWYNQNPKWVTANHPNWLTEHHNWKTPSEQQSYRKQHTMATETHHSDRRTPAVENASIQPRNTRRSSQLQFETKQNQKNQQRAADQQHQQQARREQPRQIHVSNSRSAPRHVPEQQAKREQPPQMQRRPEPAVRKGGMPQEASREQHQQEPKAAHGEQGQHGQKGGK